MTRIGWSLSLLVALAASGIASSGCLLTTDLDRFKDQGEGCDDPRNVCYRLTGFEARSEELVRVDLITNGFLHVRSIYEPIGEDTVETILPLAITDEDIEEGRDFEVQVTTDQDGNGDIVPEVDHTFSLALPRSGNLVIPESDDAGFDVPQTQAGDFTMDFVGMSAHVGQLVEVWVQGKGSKRSAGYYRVVPEGPDFSIEIPGIIGEVGSQYVVQFYADFDGSNGYEVRGGDPQGDHSWVREGTADDDGLSLSFEHTGVFEDLDIPENYGF